MATTLAGLLSGLTSTKGVALATPIVLGTALLLSIANGSAQTAPQSAAAGAAQPEVSIAKTSTLEGKATKVAGRFTASQEKEIGAIIRRYLLENPGVLVEVSRELERQQTEKKTKSHLKLISSQKQAIYHSPVDFVMGNKKGDITLVEYFDYNCGWCKRALGEVSKLREQDPNIRIVMKEFPIFGEHSRFAALAAMAANVQGKYWDFHVALMKERRVTKENTLQIAERVGLDVEKLKAEMVKPKYAAALQQNAAIAESLGIQGTPGFILDGIVNPGFMPVAAMQAMISKVRKKGCQVC